MAEYKSQYTGEQIDEAVGKALAGGGGDENMKDFFVVSVNATGLSAPNTYFSVLVPKGASTPIWRVVNMFGFVFDGSNITTLKATTTAIQAYKYTSSSISTPTIVSTQQNTVIESADGVSKTLTSAVTADTRLLVFFGTGGGAD
jgi:hypothetical protein